MRTMESSTLCDSVCLCNFSSWCQWLVDLLLSWNLPWEGINNSLKSSLVAQIVKSLPTMRETRVQSGLGRSPGEGNGNPLQYSCLENPMDRGAWWTIQSMGSQRVRQGWATSLSLSLLESSACSQIRNTLKRFFVFYFPASAISSVSSV